MSQVKSWKNMPEKITGRLGPDPKGLKQCFEPAWWYEFVRPGDRAKCWELYDLLLNDPQAFWEYMMQSPAWQNPQSDTEWFAECIEDFKRKLDDCNPDINNQDYRCMVGETIMFMKGMLDGSKNHPDDDDFVLGKWW